MWASLSGPSPSSSMASLLSLLLQLARQGTSSIVRHKNNSLFFIYTSYPFSEPTITPLAKCFCKNGYTASTGNVETLIAASEIVLAVTVSVTDGGSGTIPPLGTLLSLIILIKTYCKEYKSGFVV